MLANYEKFGFKIKAEHLPESCTWCPFGRLQWRM